MSLTHSHLFWPMLLHNQAPWTTHPILISCGVVRTRSTTTRDKNLQFQGAVSIEFLNFLSSGIFSFVSRAFCVIEEGNRPKCGENCPISRRRKERRILSCLWLSWLFRFRGRHIRRTEGLTSGGKEGGWVDRWMWGGGGGPGTWL